MEGRLLIVYLAGPMTGYEEWNFPAFLEAASKLRARGYRVLSPAEMELGEGFDPTAEPGEFTEKDLHNAMARDLRAVLNDAWAVVVLPGWQGSKGATLEVAVARAIGKPVLDLDLALSDEPLTPKEAVK